MTRQPYVEDVPEFSSAAYRPGTGSEGSIGGDEGSNPQCSNCATSVIQIRELQDMISKLQEKIDEQSTTIQQLKYQETEVSSSDDGRDEQLGIEDSENDDLDNPPSTHHFTLHGSGVQNNNTGSGTQTNNTGSGYVNNGTTWGWPKFR